MIYYCADDYGLTEFSDIHIDECIESGGINKVSVLPNCEYRTLLKIVGKKGAYNSIHLNLVEGKPLSSPEKVKDIIGKDGKFKYSFGGLLMMSLSPKKRKIEKQLYEEIKNQLTYYNSIVGFDSPLMIDSHQHTHMIPIVMKNILKVIRREKIKVGYIRIPAEPVKPYLKEPSLYLTYNPVNIIKQWLLKFLWQINKKNLKKYKIPTALFMGVLFSGNMDEKRVRKILPHYLKLAEEKNMDIEVLFHPGYIDLKYNYKVRTKKGFKNFYFSKGRKEEYDTVMNLRKKDKEVC